MSLKSDLEKDLVLAYYTNQYDRIDKLESKRESFSNLVITITVGLLTYIVATNFEMTSTLIWISLLAMNAAGCCFLILSYKQIKMHQERARKVLETYNSELTDLNKSVDKHEGFKFCCLVIKRHHIYILLHLILAGITCFVFSSSPGENVINVNLI